MLLKKARKVKNIDSPRFKRNSNRLDYLKLRKPPAVDSAGGSLSHFTDK